MAGSRLKRVPVKQGGQEIFTHQQGAVMATEQGAPGQLWLAGNDRIAEAGFQRAPFPMRAGEQIGPQWPVAQMQQAAQEHGGEGSVVNEDADRRSSRSRVGIGLDAPSSELSKLRLRAAVTIVLASQKRRRNCGADA